MSLRRRTTLSKRQGRSYRGFGGFGRTPRRAGKGQQNRFFFFERDRTGKR